MEKRCKFCGNVIKSSLGTAWWSPDISKRGGDNGFYCDGVTTTKTHQPNNFQDYLNELEHEEPNKAIREIL